MPEEKPIREVELGTIAPFGGESEGADTRIADIGLAVGDEPKYVYDFGDWIEHTIKLETISEVVLCEDCMIAGHEDHY